MFEKRFTQKAEIVLKISEKLARDLSQSFIGTEHLLYGLISETKGISYQILLKNDLFENLILEKIYELYGKSREIYNGHMAFTPRMKQLIELSFTQATNMGQSYIGTEHLLLALLSQDDSVALRILKSLKCDIQKMKSDIYEMVEEGTLPPKIGEGRKNISSKYKTIGDTPTLNNFSTDLTVRCYEGKIDPVIGRNEEIKRVIQILSRRTKNNPCLIGEPGVGKTAIAEGLAQQIAEGDVPDILKNKRVISFDIASVLAGTKYRGEFEDRVKKAMEEVKRNKNIILFIDEIHNIVGAGAAEGAIDAANILKPSLAKGEIQLIGATTIEEYRKYIEKDSALERRFQPVMVKEPSVFDTIKILEGLKDKYESHHNVKITDEAIKAAAQMSDRYIRDRFLPDKAIDLIDEAASHIYLQIHTEPRKLKKCEHDLTSVLQAKEDAIATQNYEKASLLKDEEDKIRENCKNLQKRWNNEKTQKKNIVRESDIFEIISNQTSIPIGKLTKKESDRFLNLEEELHKNVIGQDEAVNAVAKAVRRGKVGLNDPKKPIGSFLFLGPTGVGKTQLCIALAQTVCGDKNALIRLDMSEYMEKHSVSKIVGSPPGYVGYNDGGQLTEKVRRNPYSVILFDEIEKAHSDVTNILLQILDDGVLTDAQGRKIDFKNTIIVMTGNIGASLITDKNPFLGFDVSGIKEQGDYENIKKRIFDEAKKYFRPEFLNRVDELIVFRKLQMNELRQISELILLDVKKRLSMKKIYIDIDDSVYENIIFSLKDATYGARPLKRIIQEKIVDKLSDWILKGELKEFDKKVLIFFKENNEFQLSETINKAELVNGTR